MLRNRTRGGFAPRQVTWKWWATGKGGYPGTPSTAIKNVTGLVESMSDYVTPAFAQLRREGGIINNPMSQTSIEVSGSDNGWKFHKREMIGSDITDYYGECPSNWILHAFGPPAQPQYDAGLVELMRGLASTQAWSGVEAPAVQGQVMVAELKKTLNMLVKPLSGLGDFIRDSRKWEKYRGRKPKGSIRNQTARSRTKGESADDGAKAAARSWLEARFGWRPFLLEMEAVLKLLQEGDFGDRKTSRAKQERSVNSERSYTLTASGMSFDFTESVTSTYRVRTGILYQFQNTPMRDFGFSWQDLPSTAWELIPYSFVVDWFINVGDYIQAITPKCGTTVLAAWTKVDIEHRVTRTSGAARLDLPGWETQRSPNGVDRAVYKTAARSPDVHPPTLMFEVDIEHALRNSRGWDAVSLFTNTFMSHKSKGHAVT